MKIEDATVQDLSEAVVVCEEEVAGELVLFSSPHLPFEQCCGVGDLCDCFFSLCCRWNLGNDGSDATGAKILLAGPSASDAAAVVVVVAAAE